MATTEDIVPTILPAGQAGMVNHDNRLLARPTELLTANGVTFEDRHIRKEAGVENFDTAGVATAPSHESDPDDPGRWADVLMSFPGSAQAFVRAGGKSSQFNSGTLSVIDLAVPAAGHAQGSLVVVGFFVDHATPIAPVVATSVTDDKGNTYTRQAQLLVVPSLLPSHTLFVFTALLSVALVSGDEIHLNLSPGNFDAFAAFSAEFSGVSTATPDRIAMRTQTDINSTSNVTAGPVSALPSLPQLLVAVYGHTQTSANALTPSLGFTQATTASTAFDLTPDGAIDYRVDTASPIIIAIQDWQCGAEIAGGTKRAATVAGSNTVQGSASTDWTTSILPGDRIRVYNSTEIEEHEVLSITDDDTLVTVDTWNVTMTATTYTVIKGSRLVTATTGGNLFKEVAGNLDAVTLKSGLSKNARPDKFIVCGKEDGAATRLLVYVNGTDPVQVLADDGATTSDITSPATDWGNGAGKAGQRPTNGIVHQNRLVLFGSGYDPHRLYYSEPDDHQDFTGAGAITRRVRSDIGNRLWGAASFQGILFLWKYPVGIFYIDDSDADPLNWVERTKSQALGCAPSPYAVLPLDDDVLFLTATGAFHMLSAVDTLGGTKASDLSRALGLSKWLRENLDLSRLGQTLSVWYPHKKVALFSVPSIVDGVSSIVNDLMLKFDFGGVDAGEPVKFSYTRQNVPDALALRQDSDGVWKPVIGEGPYVKLLDRETRTKDGEAYTSSYQLPHLDLSHEAANLATIRKSFEHLELIMTPVASGTLTVEVYVDETLKQALTFDATKRRQRKKLNVGDGYTISLKVTNSGLSEDYKVLAHVLWFKAGNADQSRPV